MADSDDAPLQISDADRDIAIRTMLGEEGSPAGQAGVAATMLNRATSGNYGGHSLTGVAFAPKQFESWSSNANKLLSYSPDDPAYQRAAAIFDGVASGQIPDPTNGATHFYAPQLQADLGRAPPKWANGEGVQLGRSAFYAPEGRVKYQPPQQDNAAANQDLLSQYLKPEPAPANQPASSTGSGVEFNEPAATSSASTASTSPASRPVPGADLLQQYLKPEPTPGANGTPATVASPAPASSVPSNLESVSNAGASGFATGVPIVGPKFNELLDKGVAGILALKEGKPYADELAAVQAQENADNTAHPVANKVGGVAGAVTSMVPVMAAAPELFGISKAPMIANMLTGGATGATIGAADAAARNGFDPYAIKQGAIVGGLGGAAGPVAAPVIGSVVNKLANFAGRTTSAARNVANIFSEIGMTTEAAQAGLDRMGSHAVIADLDPALSNEAGGLAALGGQPTSVMKTAMAARAAAADGRAADLVNRTLGPKPDIEASLNAIQEDAAARAAPSYTSGRAGAPMDVSPVLQSIDAQLPNASGGVQSVLNKVKGFLVTNGKSPLGPVPKSDPGAILGARQAIDDILDKASQDTSMGKNAVRVAGDLRNQLDGIIKTNSDFAAGDAIYAKSMGIKDAMNEGAEVFKTGIRPQDAERAFKALTPEQQEAYRTGARSAIADAMEQSRRGELAGAQSLFARGSANRAKLDAIFPQAQDALDALHAEASMRATEHQISANSATAARRAVQQKYNAPVESTVGAAAPIVGEAIGGGPGAAAAIGLKAGYNAVRNALTERSRNLLTGGTASGLVASGAARQAFLDQVARAARIGGAADRIASGAGAGINLLARGASPQIQNLLAGQ